MTNEISENLTSIKNLAREAFLPYLPTSKKKKERFLNKVREKVNYYQPKIEEKCNIKLKHVQVKDNKEWLSDVIWRQSYLGAIKTSWENGKIPKKSDFVLHEIAGGFIGAHMFLPLLFFNQLRGADFRYSKNTIYIPFNYMNRFMDVDFKERTKRLDYTVIHELSHCLWDKLSGEIFPNEGLEDGKRKWFEGFATYCAEEYFKEFYPDENNAKVEGLMKVYSNGKKEIEKLIKEHGKEILFDIPKRWKEFEKK